MELIKKYWKWILGILLILIIGYGYYRYTKKQQFYERIKNLLEVGIFKEKEFEDVNLETTNIISNKTEKDYYDEIVLVGLNELNIDSIYVDIRTITDEVKQQFDGELELRAHILGRNKQYIIWMDDMGRSEAIKILSHELIHLTQYKNGDIVVNNEYVEWKGRRYTYDEIRNIEYRQRPWEAEAYNGERKLQFKIEDILYK